MGECGFQAISKVFLLDSNYAPESNLLEVHQPLVLRPGEMYAFVPSRR